MNKVKSIAAANIRNGLVGLLVVVMSSLTVIAQGGKRPTSIDEGNTVTKIVRPPRFTGPPPKLPVPTARRAFSWLIIQTDPENAQIAINGKPAGKAEGGEFIRELPSNKQYSITVSAGPEYDPFKKAFLLKPGSPEYIQAALKSKFASVKIITMQEAIEGAKIFVDGKPAVGEKLKVDKANNTITLDGLTPGKHMIRFDHPDYAITEREFPVEATNEYIWSPSLKRAVAELTVKTEPKTKVYIDGEFKGDTTADGTLKVSDVALGKREVKLVKEFYEEHKESREFEFGKPVPLTVKLKPVPTSAMFDELFDVVNTDRWTMPKTGGFEIKGGRLYIADTPGIISPTNIRYRDFEMSFHLKLENEGGAAWALRAKDQNNYYLFYLSGPKGQFPNQFVSYVVRDNKFDATKYFSISPIITPLKAGGQYTITVKATGNKIEQYIISADKGESVPLAFFDNASEFELGGIGFRTVRSERYSIDELYVRPQ